MQTILDLLDNWADVLRVADALSILISFIGIPWILVKLYMNKRKYKIYVECIDGDKKGQKLFIDTIRTPDLKRAELFGIVGSRKGDSDMDLSMFKMTDHVKRRTVNFPLTQADFNKWDD